MRVYNVREWVEAVSQRPKHIQPTDYQPGLLQDGKTQHVVDILVYPDISLSRLFPGLKHKSGE